MLGIPLRYLLKHPFAGVADLAADPREAWTRIQDEFVAGRERARPPCRYQSDAMWEEKLHRSLGAPWPCAEAPEFWTVWHSVMGELESKGIHAGPESFQCWNDGDAALARATWCLVRHMKPKKVVETGVAHGVTSRFVLEAMGRNGVGHLWSIDLPPIEREWRQQVGAAVGAQQAARWTYIKGSSRRRLPGLLSRVREIDIFIHDSMHSERNVRFEIDRAWAAMGQAGAVVVDDVDANSGFHSFTQTHTGQQSMIGDAEPLRPDLRRFNQKGQFGVILKQPAMPA